MKKSNFFVTLAALGIMTTSLLACTVFEGHESGGQYVDDTTITSKVKAQFVDDPSLRSTSPQIHVETMQGVVQLSGFVSSENSKERATEIASHVRGVTGVKNDIIVKGN